MNAVGIGAVADPNEEHRRLRDEIERLTIDELTQAGLSAYIALETASALAHGYLTDQNWRAFKLIAVLNPRAARQLVLLRQMANAPSSTGSTNAADSTDPVADG